MINKNSRVAHCRRLEVNLLQQLVPEILRYVFLCRLCQAQLCPLGWCPKRSLTQYPSSFSIHITHYEHKQHPRTLGKIHVYFLIFFINVLSILIVSTFNTNLRTFSSASSSTASGPTAHTSIISMANSGFPES